MRAVLSILTFLLMIFGSNAQDTSVQQFRPKKDTQLADTLPGNILHAKIIDGDTLPVVDVSVAVIFPDMDFRNSKELMKYDRLVYNVRKVYPYAKLAGEKFAYYKHVLDSLPTEKQRKAYIKQAQKELEDQFGEEVKKLTFSQGKVLIKLIYRQTGNSSYDVLKELRGGFSAFVWQSMARVFGYNLKTQYLPESDDKAIERIVQMIEAGAI